MGAFSEKTRVGALFCGPLRRLGREFVAGVPGKNMDPERLCVKPAKCRRLDEEAPSALPIERFRYAPYDFCLHREGTLQLDQFRLYFLIFLYNVNREICIRCAAMLIFP